MLIGKLIPAGSGMMAYRDYQPGVTPESRLVEEECPLDEEEEY